MADILNVEQQARLVDNISYEAAMMKHAFHQIAVDVAEAQCRPSVLFRPALSLDGSQYCALYGENLQTGVAAFGATPDEAMRAFDLAWKACHD